MCGFRVLYPYAFRRSGGASVHQQPLYYFIRNVALIIYEPKSKVSSRVDLFTNASMNATALESAFRASGSMNVPPSTTFRVFVGAAFRARRSVTSVTLAHIVMPGSKLLVSPFEIFDFLFDFFLPLSNFAWLVRRFFTHLFVRLFFYYSVQRYKRLAKKSSEAAFGFIHLSKKLPIAWKVGISDAKSDFVVYRNLSLRVVVAA